MNEETIKMLKTDKKANTEYWDEMESFCQDTVETLLTKSALDNAFPY